MLLLSAYYILVSKLTLQDDIIIGVPVSVRPNEQLEKVTGVFLNVLAMRNNPKNEKTIISFLNEVRENTLSDFENQDYPFIDLVQKVWTYKDGNRNPIFDVMFDMTNFGSFNMDMNGLDIIPYPINYTKAKYDLTLHALESENEIQLIFEYSTNLFKEDSISLFALKYIEIIKNINSNLNMLLGEINLYDANGYAKPASTNSLLDQLEEIIF